MNEQYKEEAIEILRGTLFKAWKCGYEQRRDDPKVKSAMPNHNSVREAEVLYDRLLPLLRGEFPEVEIEHILVGLLRGARKQLKILWQGETPAEQIPRDEGATITDNVLELDQRKGERRRVRQNSRFLIG